MKTRKKNDHTRDARISRRKDRRDIRLNEFCDDVIFSASRPVREIKPLRPITERQCHYLTAIDSNTITFGIGPAGTGKSYCAGGYAADMLREGKIEKIIITRPGVEAGESFGFLPGEIEEKYAPYIEPFRDILNNRLGKSQVDYFMSHGKIVASPLSFMRGKTFSDCVVILDEAQNTTPKQLLMFLTRIGENCKVIVDGDIEQKDIAGLSGLQDAIFRLKKVPSVQVIEFTVDDVVRSGIVGDIIRAYAG